MKILIVEDDNFSREYLQNLLRLERYEFYSAKNGMEGLEIFEKERPDLILSDIQMPIMDGLELLEAVRGQKSDTIFIVVTAFGSEEYAIKALRLGANNYLKKPIIRADLVALLKKYKFTIESKQLTSKKYGKVIRREFSVIFPSTMNLIQQFVDQLVSEVEHLFQDSEQTNIELGLVELITNSIEHGNMEISYSEKSKSLQDNTLHILYEAKQHDPVISNRVVTVNFKMDSEGCEWTISDEGKGFDWQNVPNPVKGDNILELHGRGIFICRFLFDSIEYFGKGNQVRVKKLFTNEQEF